MNCEDCGTKFQIKMFPINGKERRVYYCVICNQRFRMKGGTLVSLKMNKLPAPTNKPKIYNKIDEQLKAYRKRREP